MTTYTHRIRRCKGKRDAFMLVALTDDGRELDTPGAWQTALSIDHLLKHAGGLRPEAGDVVEIDLS